MVGSKNIFVKSLVSILIMAGVIVASFPGYSSEIKKTTLNVKQCHPFNLATTLIENNLEDEDGLDEKGKSIVLFYGTVRNIFFPCAASTFTFVAIEITERRSFLLFRYLRI